MKAILAIFTLLLWGGIAAGQSSHFIKTADGQIHYRIFGEGPPILIINGGPGFNSNGFESLARALSGRGYRSILFDQRGTGQSHLVRREDSLFTMQAMVEDIEAIRKDLALSKWIVLGHSFGGMLANYYSAQHPGRVRAMILSSSGGMDLSLLQYASGTIEARFTAAERDSLDHWRSLYGTAAEAPARAKYNQLFARAYVYDSVHVPVIAQRLGEADLAINRLIWQDMRRINFDTRPALASFESPVLIIQGSEDIVPPALAHMAHDVLPNSELIFIGKCGHYGWIEQREIYLQSIEDFLKSEI